MTEQPLGPGERPGGSDLRRGQRRGRWAILVALVVIVSVSLIVVLSQHEEVGNPGTNENAVATEVGASATNAGTATTTTPGQMASALSESTTEQIAAPPAITVSGDAIERGGQEWWLLGYNSFTWSGDCGNPDELMSVEQTDEWFDSMRHDGHGAVRLMFFEGWNIDRLDAAIQAAARNNIYVTITLDNGNQDCGEEDKNEDWFSNPDKRDEFAAHMTEMLERYKGNTTIAWFEYFNEPDYHDGALRTFYDEMGELAATIDPDRLFSSGTIASYSLGGDANFRDVQESAGVDIVSLHEYDYDEAESHHGPAVRANSAGKPIIVGEFGVIDAGQSEQQCEADIGKRVERVERKIDAYLGTEGYVGAFAWSWQPGRLEGACRSPGLDLDQDVQQVMRTWGRP